METILLYPTTHNTVRFLYQHFTHRPTRMVAALSLTNISATLEQQRLQHMVNPCMSRHNYNATVQNVRILSTSRCMAVGKSCHITLQGITILLVTVTSYVDDVAKDFNLYNYIDHAAPVEPKRLLKESVSKLVSIEELKHVCKRHVIEEKRLASAFEGVLEHYHEQQLKEYSRYKDWRQSCYMEVHKVWTPQVPVTVTLFKSMEGVLNTAKDEFSRWYAAKNGLEQVQVETLNSFITKYIPVDGKAEFGKHIDGAKIDGSLILALPTDDPNDWPGLKVWDGPKGIDRKRPEHHVELAPGDACFLDTMVWHHGLPITKGKRYVMVCFYKCKWKKIKMPNY